MIQRTQTLFLILAFISSVLLIFMPLVSYKELLTDSDMQVYVLFTKINNSQIVFSTINFVFFALMLILPLANIFLYKNRELQVKLCYVNIVVTLLLVIIIAYKLHNMDDDSYTDWDAKIGVAAFSLNIIFVLLAKQFIVKDQKLIESANRLR